jgi:hypothetical protein
MNDLYDRGTRLPIGMAQIYDRLLETATRGAGPLHEVRLHRRIVKYTPRCGLVGAFLGIHFWLHDRWIPLGVWWIPAMFVFCVVITPICELLAEWLIFSRNRI